MTVGELISKLSDFDSHIDVEIPCQTGGRTWIGSVSEERDENGDVTKIQLD